MPSKPQDVSSELDETDWSLLSLLQANARMTQSDLARALDLSRAATSDRLKRLEDLGVIIGYTIRISPRAVGMRILAFVGVVMEHPKYRGAFLKMIQAVPEILECHHVTGEFDYLLKIRCRDTDDLEYLSSRTLKGMRALVRTQTMISLLSEKDTTQLPLPPRTSEADA